LAQASEKPEKQLPPTMATSRIIVGVALTACVATATVPEEWPSEAPVPRFGDRYNPTANESLPLAPPFARRLWSRRPAYNDCEHPQQFGETPVPYTTLEDFFSDFRPLAEIHRFITELQTQYPDLVHVRTIGNSWEGRPLQVMEITDRSPGQPGATEKPTLVIEGGVHAREWIAPAALLYIALALVRNAGDASVRSLLKNFVVSVYAPVNPDGYVYSWEVDRMWRKTRSNRPDFGCPSRQDGVAGVDANRNWGFSWGNTTNKEYERHLHDPCSEVFIGPSSFAEPEIRAIAEYMRSRQESSSGYVAAFLDYHSAAQKLLPPWAYTASAPANPDGAYQAGLTDVMVTAFRHSSGRVFRAGADEFPPDPGTGPDWAYGVLGIRATMTVELEGSRGWSSSQFFCLASSEIKSVGKEQFAGLLAIAAYLKEHGSEPVNRHWTSKEILMDDGSPGNGLVCLLAAVVACFPFAGGLAYRYRNYCRKGARRSANRAQDSLEMGLRCDGTPLD